MSGNKNSGPRGKKVSVELFQELRAKLQAETTRRLEAEEVVDVLLVPVVIADDLPELIQEAEGYRAKYPKDSNEK